MVGVDTNILLRFALEDDWQQSAAATEFLEDEQRLQEPALICPVALVELVWTLMRIEGFDKPQILKILDAFTDSRRVAYSDDVLIVSSIEQWRGGKAELADYLIGALNLQAGAKTTVTFDKTAARQPNFSLLPS